MDLKRLFVAVVLVGSVAVIGCGDDGSTESGGTGGTAGAGGTAGSGGTAGTGGSGTAACFADDCATSEVLRAACFMVYNPCVDLGGDEAKCRADAEAANCRLTD